MKITAILLSLVAAALVGCSTVSATKIDKPAETIVTKAPLAAIAVSECGQALALFVLSDPTHMFRADPRQSDVFEAGPGGEPSKMKQTTGPGIKWQDAIQIATAAAIQTHVVIPCTEGPAL